MTTRTQITVSKTFLTKFENRLENSSKIAMEECEKEALKEKFDLITKRVEKLTDDFDESEGIEISEVVELSERLDNIRLILLKLKKGKEDQAMVTKVAPKMPTIPLPTFNGDVELWPRFWSKFSSLIGENTEITSAMKQHFLISCLTDGAKKTVQHMESTSNCYQMIVQILNDTFNRPEQAASKIFGRLIKREEKMRVSDFIIQLQENLGELENIQDNLKSVTNLVAYITLEKLTPAMKEKYYQNYNCGERLTIKNVVEFLQNQNEVDSNQLAIGPKNIFNKSMAMEDKQN
jgi:Protein of unknown function (DUF1759)